MDDNREYQVAERFRRELNKGAERDRHAVRWQPAEGRAVQVEWISTDPDSPILDEPTRGIDVAAEFEN